VEEEIIITSNVEAVASAGMVAIDGLSASLAGVDSSALVTATAAVDGLNSSLGFMGELDFGALESAKEEATALANAAADASADVGTLVAAIDGVDNVPIDGATKSTEKLGDAAKETGKEAEGSAGEFNAYMEIAKKALQVVGFLFKIGAAAASATLDQIKLRESLGAMLDQTTGGRGTAVFDSLSAMARKLNLDVGETTTKFDGFRKAGASNIDAANLIKLGADIEAVGGSADQAKDATKRALDAIKAGGDASSVIKGIAAEFGAVGNGANASAKASLTFSGMLGRIAGMKDQAFADIGKGLGPSLDVIGAKVVGLFDKFSAGDTGVIDALAAGLAYIPSLIDGMVAGFDVFLSAAQPGIDALKGAFGLLGDSIGTTGGAAGAFKVVFGALGAVVSVMAGAVAGLVAIWAGMIQVWDVASAAVGAVVEAVSGAIDSISEFSLADAGSNLIDSLIDGILGGIGSIVGAISAVGSAVSGAIDSALEIGSPSKIGTRAGSNVIQSVGIGGEEAAPGAASLIEAAGAQVGGALSSGVGSVDVPTTGLALDGGVSDATGAKRGASGGSIRIDQKFEIHASGDSDEIARKIAIRCREETMAVMSELGYA